MAAAAPSRGFRAAEVSEDRGENEPPPANIRLRGAPPPLPPSSQAQKDSQGGPPSRRQKEQPTAGPLCLALSPLDGADDAGRRDSVGGPMGSPEGAPLSPLLRGGGLARGLRGPLALTRGPPSVSSVQLLLAEAPEPVRELWSASFEVKRLRRRHFVLQADLRVVSSWVFGLLNDDTFFSSPEGLLDQARFAAAVAVYGQLLPQLIWAVAVAASSLGNLTLQETRALWARLQLLALDATSSSAAVAAAGGGSSSKARGGLSSRQLGPSSALFGSSRAFGRRKRRRSQHQQQQQQQHETGLTLEALDAAAGSSAEPELLLQQLSQQREALSLRDGNEPKASAVLSRLLNEAEGEAPSLRPSPVSSPFAELRRELLQLGALRSPAGSERFPPGASTAGSSTTSLAAAAQGFEPATAAAAAAAGGPGGNNSNSGGFGGPDRWMLMPWQSAAAAAAAALQQGLSRRSSFSSVASELLPTGQQQQQHQEVLLQGPLSIEVPVGAAVDPAVASPFRLQQQQRRPLPPSEPSSVGSAGSKRTAASSAAVGTPDGRWAPDLLLQQQDMDLGDWQLPGEDPMWQQATDTPAAAAAEGGGSGEEQVALAIPEVLPLTARIRIKKRRQQQHKVQLDAIVCRSQAAAAAAARSEADGAAAAAAAKAAAAAVRLLEAGTEDADTLRGSLRCYWGVLHRQLSLRASLLQQHEQQQQQQRLLSKRFGGAASVAAHSGGALLACSLLCGLAAPVLPSSVRASAAALRGLCQGDSVVRAALEQQQQQQLQQKQQPQQAAAAEGTAVAAEAEALSRAGLKSSPAGLEGKQEAAAEAEAAAAGAAAAAAAVASRRRRSSWLERENVLKGFGSPLRSEGFNEGGGGDDADTWEDSPWGGALDDVHPQQQQQQQQQVLLQPLAHENAFDQAFAEEGGLAGLHGFVPPLAGSTGAPPQGTPRQYRNREGAAVSLWPSAASLLELVERASRPSGAGLGATASPGGEGGPPDLAQLLEGHSRRTAARAFRDALSLHSLGLCMLKQETAEEGLTKPGSLEGSQSYPPLLILSQEEAAREAAATRAAGGQPAAAAAATAAAAAASASPGGSTPVSVDGAGGKHGRGPEPVSPLVAAAASADDEGEALPSPLAHLQQQPAAELVREQAAGVAAAAADAAAAEAEKTGDEPITDEQLEQAVQWLVTGLLDRLQEQPRVHAHQLVHWLVYELLPRSEFAGIASPKAWEAKAVYAVCTLIDERVLAASAAAVGEAPVNLTVSCRTLQGDTELLACPFWLEGVADVD